MQRFKALLATNRSLQSLRCLHRQRRSLSSVLPNAVEDEEPKNHVLVEGRGCSRLAILDRPSSLNALTTSMAARLTKLYQSWEENPDIGYVVMKGSGRAFSAGGDIVTLYRQLNEGKVEHCKDFFRTLYKFIYLLGTYLKPHVAFLNGITMGGGAGVSIPGTFRVATDKTIFSTPETQIGFHPDAGASFYLSHLPGYLGEYLALTGASLNGAEMIACGLATHYSLNEKLNTIEDRLANLMTDDPSIIETQLNQYGTLVYPENKSVVFRTEEIDKCFGHDTVEEIIDTLEQEVAETNNDWCTSALKKLKEASPLSLKVSLRSVREGRYQSLDQCLIESIGCPYTGSPNEFLMTSVRVLEQDWLTRTTLQSGILRV
ncbi:hypothetical protein QJS10_CPA10g00853 [Acorus calamus]|uniref:3-hydroxyisobutyryl-CoA hydrolase n=1 Tax=Acorus calamus TaxID=4465 RepID=A0AAV9E151_ACOCL|nr:hypothetical protein QJS10_CPA10g00853 [Acorus calamus]